MTRAHNRLNLLLVVAVDVVVVVGVAAATRLGLSDLVAIPMPRRQPLPVLLLLREEANEPVAGVVVAAAGAPQPRPLRVSPAAAGAALRVTPAAGAISARLLREVGAATMAGAATLRPQVTGRATSVLLKPPSTRRGWILFGLVQCGHRIITTDHRVMKIPRICWILHCVRQSSRWVTVFNVRHHRVSAGKSSTPIAGDVTCVYLTIRIGCVRLARS